MLDFIQLKWRRSSTLLLYDTTLSVAPDRVAAGDGDWLDLDVKPATVSPLIGDLVQPIEVGLIIPTTAGRHRVLEQSDIAEESR